MPEENSSFSSIQQALLIPAFEAIVALLKEKGVQATVSSTEYDSKKGINCGEEAAKECVVRLLDQRRREVFRI